MTDHWNVRGEYFPRITIDDLSGAWDPDWLRSIPWTPPRRGKIRNATAGDIAREIINDALNPDRILPRPDDIEGTCTEIIERKELNP